MKNQLNSKLIKTGLKTNLVAAAFCGLVIALACLSGTTLIWAADEGVINPTAEASGKTLTPSELEKLFPMSPEVEASLVHVVPSCTVIIDGIEYPPDQINKFDGQRLRFTIGEKGELYAFTRVEDLEKFQAAYQKNVALRSVDSMFYVDWWYGGQIYSLPTSNHYQPFLGSVFDNAISSVKAGTGVAWVYLCDEVQYGGDYLSIAGGSDIPILQLYGWNDRTSSIWTE
jgi:hypothetical protein